ncbi:hypothetical protein GGF32_004710 [Allomyces javanicus]|nr:hypothetical protein GGF32_004710 [Allomyces javanicus]
MATPAPSKLAAAAAAPAATPAPAAAAAGAPAPAVELGPDGRPMRKSMKEMSKAERRAYQEAQRKAKEAAKASGTPPPKKGGAAAQNKAQGDGASAAGSNAAGRPSTGGSARGADGASTPATPAGGMTASSSSMALAAAATAALIAKAPVHKTLSLFSHLPPPASERGHIPGQVPVTMREALHPVVVRLGLQFANFTIAGANARCRAMLEAFKHLIRDYVTPPDAVLSRHLTQFLGAHISYLSDIRPLAPCMGNAIRQLKHEISVLGIDISDKDAKQHLLDRIDEYIHERITMAIESLAQHGVAKIKDGDVILTYGHSSTVRHLLVKAHTLGRRFRVIVVDARPRREGRRMAQALLDAGITTTYVLVNALGYVIREASKVILGAHGLLGNGALMSRAGTAQVALLASHLNLPVIATCETYKFSLSIHLDSVVFNELADPDELVPQSRGTSADKLPLSTWRETPNLKVLNLLYDVTPPEFITVVITEVGLMPTTSVPVVIREYKPLLEQ